MTILATVCLVGAGLNFGMAIWSGVNRLWGRAIRSLVIGIWALLLGIRCLM